MTALMAHLLWGCNPLSETPTDPASRAFSELGLGSDLSSGWVLETSRADPKGEWQSASFKRADTTIRVRVLSPFDRDQFVQFQEEQDSLIHALFGTRPASYPGHLTNQIKCPPRFQPKRIELGASDIVYSLFAGERLSFGGCGEDLVVYRAGLRFLHCAKNQTAVRIEVFVPKEERSSRVDELVRSVHCQKR